MLQKLKSFIAKHQLIEKSDKIGLAISGGKDSVAAAHMLNALKQPFVLVHVNFCLRGDESDGDQQFVSETAANLEYCEALFVKRIDTKAYVLKHKTNTQQAARDIRYQFFDELKRNGQFDKLITAHHKSDVLETFFINLYRTSGIQGLKSIPVKRDYIIRPFLAFTSVEIENYVESHNLPFRTDSSNQDTKYLRNKVRQNVLPAISSSLPDFEERALKSISYLNQENDLFEHLIQSEIEKVTSIKNGRLRIQKNTLLGYPQSSVILYRILDEFGFSPQQCSDIVHTCMDKSGLTFHTNSAELIVDRDYLFVQKVSSAQLESLEIPGPGNYTFGRNSIAIEKISKASFTNNFNVESVTLSEDLFPLNLRNWQEGDRFQPLGMKGSKLLSDFFIDQKIDIQTKKNISLLCSGNEILWVVGYRISEKIKVIKNQNLYRMSYQHKTDS